MIKAATNQSICCHDDSLLRKVLSSPPYVLQMNETQHTKGT